MSDALRADDIVDGGFDRDGALDGDVDQVVRHLMERRPALAVRVTAEMFQDPFWSERFPARGRRFSEEDAQYHVAYLCQAIVERDRGVLERYACWLRGVLTARGMCTLHLAENFDRLATAIAEESVKGAQAAAAVLRSAIAALDHQPPARELADAAATIATAMDGATAEALRERRHLMSFLADAVANDRADVFVAHVRWLSSSPSRAHRGGTDLRDDLARLQAVMADQATLSAEARAAAAGLLEQARAALVSTAPREAAT